MPSEELIKKAISTGKSALNGTLNKTSNVISNPNGSASVNYNDSRFQQVETDKNKALNEIDQTYGEMIGNSDSYYQAQIDASKQWADKQTEIQNQQTDFAIEKIEQEKAKAEKDYTKEQSGAYVDWQKQSNKYGVNAERMASSGMTNTGYSESSQVAMYTAYQNRVAVARESYNNAVLNYNNLITEAKLQNSSVLADIAIKALQQQLEIGLEGFQYKNQLILDKANKKLEVENTYYNRYQDVLAQINQENALAEQIRQYNESQAFKEKQLAEEIRQFNEQLKEEQRQYNQSLALSKAKASSSGSSGGSTPRAKLEGDDDGAKLNNNNTTNNNTSNNQKGTVSTKTKNDLGYGPITDETVAKLVQNGVVEIVKDSKGNDTLKKAPGTPNNLKDALNYKAPGLGLVTNMTSPLGIKGKTVSLPKTPQLTR
jgi:hypothetical protein